MYKTESIPVKDVAYIQINYNKTLTSQGYSFLCITEGQVSALHGTFTSDYPMGSLFLLAPDEEVQMTCQGEATVLLVSIDANFVYDHMNGHRMLVCDSVAQPEHDYLAIKQQLLTIAESFMDEANRDSLALSGNLYLLLAQLRKMQPDSITRQETSTRYQERIRDIEAYIDAHITEPLTLTQIASAFYLTPQYFSSFMKSAFQQNFKSYLTERRLYYACRDLRSSQLPITEIALRSGFGSVSVFRKNFAAAFQMSPLQYRKKYQNQQNSGHADDSAIPDDDNQANVPSPAQEGLQSRKHNLLTQHLIVDSRQGQAQFKHISSVINIGPASNLLSSRFRKQILTLHNEMSLTHLRIEDFVSNSFIPRVLPDYNYYFQNTDDALNFLYEHNLSPWIELSRLPADRRPITNENLTYYSVNRGPRFLQLLEHFLNHIAEHWPTAWTRSWRFELWMSPTESPSEYIATFREVSALLQTYLPGTRLGGPGYNRTTTPASIEEILAAFHKENVQPDFFSLYMHYHVPAGKTSPRPKHKLPELTISADPEYMEKTVAEARHTLDTLMPNTPLVVSEWNSAWIAGLPVADSRYQAAFIMRTLLKLAPYCDIAAYWLLNDTPQATGMLNPTQFYYFGQGLLNHEAIPTAAYFAYRMINHMRGQVLSMGDNYCVTKTDPTHYQALAFHYTHLAPSGQFPDDKSLAFETIYSFFRKEDDVNVSIHLEGLEPGTYLVTRTLIDLNHGSILDIMIGEFTHSNLDRIDFLRYTKSPSPQDIAYLTTSCNPQRRHVFRKCEGSLVLEHTLASHDICLWDIRKQV